MTLVRIKHSESTLFVFVFTYMYVLYMYVMCTVIVVRETVPMLSLGLLCCILYPCLLCILYIP